MKVLLYAKNGMREGEQRCEDGDLAGRTTRCTRIRSGLEAVLGKHQVLTRPETRDGTGCRPYPCPSAIRSKCHTVPPFTLPGERFAFATRQVQLHNRTRRIRLASATAYLN